MNLSFRVAEKEALNSLCQLYQTVVTDMRRRGLKQWEWGKYPTRDMLAGDIAAGNLYQMMQDGRMVGAFVLTAEQEPQYAALNWHFGVRPATVHRVALLPDSEGLGLGQRLMLYAKEEAVRLGHDSLRLDTSSQNERALKLFRGTMTREVGTIYFPAPDADTPYYCFESPIVEACPLLPIRMHPAYRHGDMTPWGGDGLQRLFSKDIPDDRTGESMEISAILGLESKDDMGVGLRALISRYGKPLVGDKKEFPLLLKLIAARDKLSVQVHPGDAYAREHEGKLGKSEAWVILSAEEGAGIQYGINDGVSRESLQAALDAGEDIEPMIAWMPVKAGDVFYMPSGMVHAIGGGIVLYEIQQSSDVTYRLWDYMRKNDKGEMRELHLKQAMDVVDTGLRGQRTQLPEAGVKQEEGVIPLLDVPAFTLACACVQGELALPAQAGSFRMLTALEPLTLRWEGGELELVAGESALLGAQSAPLMLVGTSRALIAWAK